MKNAELRIEKEELRIGNRVSRMGWPSPQQFLILPSQSLICCVSLLLCSVATADSLKFKFSPGDKYSLVSVTEQKMARVADGDEQTSEQITQLECDFDVEEVDESGCAWAKYTYKRVTMKLRAAKQKLDFDSDANQVKTPMQAVPFRLAMGEGLYLRITPQGRIEKINGLQAIITSAKAKIGNFAGADKISQSITQLFAEPAVRRQMEDQLMIFPEPNEPDTTWSRTRILSSAEAGYFKAEQVEEVNLVFEKTFRRNPDKSSQGGIAVVDVNLVIKPVSAPVLSTPPERDGQAQASESTVRSIMEVLGGGVGQIEIEKATGRIISSKMTQDTTERVIYIAQGQMLRPPPAPEPITRHTVTTFQMAQREPPAPSKVEGDKPARPADANEKGS
jgi:hypothetical protein